MPMWRELPEGRDSQSMASKSCGVWGPGASGVSVAAEDCCREVTTGKSQARSET